MESIYQGAFPFDRRDPHTKEIDGQWYGLTIRDYFAAKAMQAILTNDALLKTISKENCNSTQTLAESAYEMADAMLKQREI